MTDLPGASPEGGPSSDSLGAVNSGPGRDGLPTTARPGSFSSDSPVTTLGENAGCRARVGGVLKPRPTHWTPLKISALIALWNEGLSTSEIGNRLGISKNAVIGRVHRLGLPKRNSPIIRTPPPQSSSLLTLEKIGPNQCRFPLGGPKERAIEFCGEPVIEGKPYCGPHAARCFLKPSRDKGVPFHFEKIGTKA